VSRHLPAYLTPVWLAREHVGLAHAFLPSRVADGLTVTRSCCGTVTRDVGLPWERASFDRTRCRTCEARIAEAERTAERASQASKGAR
jgi:hypothetical protein